MVLLFLISGIVTLNGAASGFVAVNLGSDLTVALAFSLAFVAGFSEGLLLRVVISVTGTDAQPTDQQPR